MPHLPYIKKLIKVTVVFSMYWNFLVLKVNAMFLQFFSFNFHVNVFRALTNQSNAEHMKEIN